MAPSSTGHRRRQPPRPLKRDNELPPASGKRRPCRDVAMVRSSQALRCLQGQSALYTLIHQRHPAPSCGGHAPTAERTMDPARNFKKRNFTESLTPDPELENKPGNCRAFELVNSLTIGKLPPDAGATRLKGIAVMK